MTNNMVNMAKAEEPESAGKVTEFKRFLSSRPAVSNLVFSYAAPSGSLSGPMQTNFFHAAWEGDNFFVRQIPSAKAWAEKTSQTFLLSPIFCGRYGGKYFYVQRGLIVEGPVAPLPPTTEPIEPITSRALGELLVLEACLNLGLWDTQTNSFVWKENEFTATMGIGTEISRAMVLHQGKVTSEPGVWEPEEVSKKTVTGRIEIDGEKVRQMDSIAKSLTLKYEYVEANPLTPPLPNRTSVFSGGLLRGAFEILRLETSADPLGDAYFAPDNFLEPGTYHRTVLTAEERLKIEEQGQAHQHFIVVTNQNAFTGKK
jgi:hypothetical protein